MSGAGRTAGSAAGRFLRMLPDLLFPPRCPLCGEVLPQTLIPPDGADWDRRGQDGKIPACASGSVPGICGSCARDLPFVRGPRCVKCSRTIRDESELLCPDCEKSEKHFRYGLALFDYDDRLQYAVTQIKYHNQRSYMKPLAALLVQRLGQELIKTGAECVVPVPVHPTRRRKRGFNQAELLAEEAAPALGIPVRPELLIRRKRTEAQKALTPEQRVKNLSEAFQAAPEAAEVQSVLLADDIYTTGSTIEACSRALLSAGVREVYFFTLCIVPPE